VILGLILHVTLQHCSDRGPDDAAAPVARAELGVKEHLSLMMALKECLSKPGRAGSGDLQ